MSVSFLRIDDRMIHGQTVTRWSLEYPCDGLVAVHTRVPAQRKHLFGHMKHGKRKTRKY